MEFFINPCLRTCISLSSQFENAAEFHKLFQSLEIGNVSDVPNNISHVDLFDNLVKIVAAFKHGKLPKSRAKQSIETMIARAYKMELAQKYPICGFPVSKLFAGSTVLRSYNSGLLSRDEAVDRLSQLQKQHNESEAKIFQIEVELEQKSQDIVPLKTIPFDFCQAVREARAAKSMTQASLAKSLNVKVSDIKNWENPNSNALFPKPIQIQNLKRVLGISLPK